MEFIQVGILGIAAFSFLIVVSLRPIRKAAYELFYFLHFVMALCVNFPSLRTTPLTPVITAFSSLAVISTPRHRSEHWCPTHLFVPHFLTFISRVTYWFWVSFLIWGLDRLLRVVRVVVFNHSYFGFRKGSGTMDASVELISPRFVRLRLRRPPHFSWSPGQTAYLIMPGVSTTPFEAHPFTIASVDTVRDGTHGDIMPITKEGTFGESEPYWKELVFFINVRNGFTKNLCDVAEKGGKVKVFIDGPYGKPPDLTDYDTSVLIAGGSGVSFALPLLLDSIK